MASMIPGDDPIGGVLAHQGGWDELLLAGSIVLAFLGWSWVRGRRPANGSDPGRADGPQPCPYCDAALRRGATRCPECGFRVPTRRTG